MNVARFANPAPRLDVTLLALGVLVLPAAAVASAEQFVDSVL
jgi:hypothetical protein